MACMCSNMGMTMLSGSDGTVLWQPAFATDILAGGQPGCGGCVNKCHNDSIKLMMAVPQ